MKMLNSNLCCVKLDSPTEKVGKILIPTDKKSYKRLKVVQSEEEEVEVGKTLYVPINSGHEVDIDNEVYVIVNIREIILIL